MDEIQNDFIFYFCIAIAALAALQDLFMAGLRFDNVGWRDLGWRAATCYALPACVLVAYALGGTRLDGTLYHLPGWAHDASTFWRAHVDDWLFGGLFLGTGLAALPGRAGRVGGSFGLICLGLMVLVPAAIAIAGMPFGSVGDFALVWKADLAGREAQAASWILPVGLAATFVRGLLARSLRP